MFVLSVVGRRLTKKKPACLNGLMFKKSFPHWDAYAANNLDDSEYLRGRTSQELPSGVNLTIVDGLYLTTRRYYDPISYLKNWVFRSFK